MTATLFFGFALLVALSLVTICFKYLPTGSALRCTGVLLVWLSWVGILSLSGRLADLTLRPPAIAYIVGPLMVFMVLVLATHWGGTFSTSFPIRLLLGAQVFRVAVEILLYLLWKDGQIPRMLTWDGANFDVVIGLTAPFVAWAAARGRAGRLLAQAWTLAGVLMLTNVVVRSVLTAPGPLQLPVTEVPNLLPGQFPFVYLVGFLAPLALLLHLMAIRSWYESSASAFNADQGLNSPQERSP